MRGHDVQATVCGAQQEPTFHVDVPLVNVFVSVTDKAGAPIGGLAKEDFELSENGKPQKIAVFERDTSAPLAIVIAVDLSGSMYKDFAAEQQAAQRFAKDVLRKQDRADLVAFADGTNEVTGFTGDAKRIAGGLTGCVLVRGVQLFTAPCRWHRGCCGRSTDGVCC